ncbi:MAG: DUF6515 family protein [Burkholderiaceae bacterium]
MKARRQCLRLGIVAMSLATFTASSVFAQPRDDDRHSRDRSRANVRTKPAPSHRAAPPTKLPQTQRIQPQVRPQARPNNPPYVRPTQRPPAVVVQPHQDRHRPPAVVVDRRPDHARPPVRIITPPPRARYVAPPPIRVLPPRYRSVDHGGQRLFLADRWWYRHTPSGYVSVIPPFGFVTPYLPAVFATVAIGGLVYYVAEGVYYQRVPSGYEVVPAPASVPETGLMPPIYVYPAQGQTEQQTAADRYDCHRWATGQSGFDPTITSGGVPPENVTEARGNYRRAIEACLEARGYSVN